MGGGPHQELIPLANLEVAGGRRGDDQRDFSQWHHALDTPAFADQGEGEVSVSTTQVSHMGKLSPGPDYKLYLVKGFVEDEAQFEAVRTQAARIGDVKTFNGFVLEVPSGVNVDDYDTAVVWCETFSEFISAAKYR